MQRLKSEEYNNRNANSWKPKIITRMNALENCTMVFFLLSSIAL